MALHKTSGRWKTGLALAITATTLWGTLPIALLLMLESLDVYTITWYRLLGAGLALYPYLAVTRRLPRLSRIGRKGQVMLAAASLTLCGNYLFYLFGLNFISPSAAQVVIQMAPLLLLFGGLFVFREHFSIQQWLGLVLFVAGLLLFFHPHLAEIVQGVGNTSKGIFWIVVASACWAVYALLQKQLLRDMSSVQIMFCIYLVCGLVILPLSQPQNVLQLDGVAALILLFCVLNSLIAYGCFAEALAHWEASRVSAILALSPILTIVMMMVGARLFPGHLEPENLDFLSLLGAVLVVLGSLVAALWSSSRKRG